MQPTNVRQNLLSRSTPLGATIASIVLILASVASAQEPPDLRATVSGYLKEVTLHSQFESDIRRGSWKIVAKQIQSSQKPDKTFAVSIRYRVEGTKGESCDLEFQGPLEDKKGLNEVPLLRASC